MSGIFGLFNQDGAPVEPRELSNMASLLTRRGPDRTGTWHLGAVGMGHTLLATTPEGLLESLPLEHAESGCVITADVRLDNRAELLAKLGLADRAVMAGDAEIVLSAYLAWSEACVERLLGDFAFAIWDPQRRALFCARDHMGMRSLYYHHTPGRFFAFATAPRAVLVLPQTPYRISEARIADFLVEEELEGIDKSSTFFEEVFRLLPAHAMTVTPNGLLQRRYWTLEPGPELRLTSDEAAEELLEVFTEAVRCRLRTVGPVGSMLSGGVDSGSVVAVARQLLAAESRGPLLTFSAVSPDGDTDPETRAIHAALSMDGLDPNTVSYGKLDDLLPELAQLTGDVDEPFDAGMTLVRAVYLAAHRRGLKVLLDGGGGDVVLSEGRRLARLIRAGHWRTAYREAVGQNRFWNGAYPPARVLVRNARAAFVPNAALRPLRPLRRRLHLRQTIHGSLMSEDFARRVDLAERLQVQGRRRARVPLSNGGLERARTIESADLTVGRESYDRVAAAVGIEPRDPFLDLRVISFCVRLPSEHTSEGGWPKPLLRRAMAGRLPDDVRWGRRKEHLGPAFTKALMDKTRDHIRREVVANLPSVSKYVDVNAAQIACRSYFDETEVTRAEEVYALFHLGTWLRRHGERPKAEK